MNNLQTEGDIKMKKPLTFYRKEREVKTTNVETGIGHYCCSDMKRALFDDALAEKDFKIQLYQHITDPPSYIHYVEKHKTPIKYCPFCGTKINGVIEK